MEWSETYDPFGPNNLRIYICNICSFRERGLKEYIMHLVGAHIKGFVQCHRKQTYAQKRAKHTIVRATLHRHYRWPLRSSKAEFLPQKTWFSINYIAVEKWNDEKKN